MWEIVGQKKFTICHKCKGRFCAEHASYNIHPCIKQPKTNNNHFHTQAKNRKICQEILKNFIEKLEYDIDYYKCVEFSITVYNALTKEKIPAKIAVGNLEKDWESIIEANHAWVMAMISPDFWIPLETTNGMIITTDSRYNSHCLFNKPKDIIEYIDRVKEHEKLVNQYNDSLLELNQVIYILNNHRDTFELRLEYQRREAVLQARFDDITKISHLIGTSSPKKTNTM